MPHISTPYVRSISLFFFFKQKTAYELRISDWSSDVCSSDLKRGVGGAAGRPPAGCQARRPGYDALRPAAADFPVAAGGIQAPRRRRRGVAAAGSMLGPLWRNR